MKKLLIAMMIAVIGVGCQHEDFSRQEARATSQLMSEALKRMGMPNIVNFSQRREFKTILEKADQNLLTYSYVQNQFTGRLRFLGRSVGYGIPFSAQYTNPKRVEKIWGDVVTVDQPDPNGLYMPTSSSATWVLLIDDNTGDINLVYIESPLTVTQYPLPSYIADYPPDFWEKYNEGKLNMSEDELKEKLRKFGVEE